MTEVRGKKIGIIFQNPLDSLNPVYTVGYQMTEGLLVDKMDKKEAYQLACDMLRDVKISDVEERMKTYPHEISGGYAAARYDRYDALQKSAAFDCR